MRAGRERAWSPDTGRHWDSSAMLMSRAWIPAAFGETASPRCVWTSPTPSRCRSPAPRLNRRPSANLSGLQDLAADEKPAARGLIRYTSNILFQHARRKPRQDFADEFFHQFPVADAVVLEGIAGQRERLVTGVHRLQVSRVSRLGVGIRQGRRREHEPELWPQVAPAQRRRLIARIQR